jgi:hypothetical protein
VYGIVGKRSSPTTGIPRENVLTQQTSQRQSLAKKMLARETVDIEDLLNCGCFQPEKIRTRKR